MAHNNPTGQEAHHLDQKTIWLFFIQYFLRLFVYIPMILGLASTVFLIRLMERQPQGAFDPTTLFRIPILTIMAYFIISVLISYIFARLTFANWKYQITEDALRIEKGIIWKKYVSIPYEKIQNVDILRGILARLLKLSDIQIQTAGISALALSEGRLPGLSIEAAETLRDSLVKKSKGTAGV